MSVEQLICPNNGDVCDYYQLCSQLKGGGDVNNYTDQVDRRLPTQVTDVLTSYCSNERILALACLGNVSLDTEVQLICLKRKEQIETSQSFFNPGELKEAVSTP